MENIVNKKRIIHPSKESKYTKELLESSFPKIEIMEYEDYIKHSTQDDVDFWAYFDRENNYIGFAYILVSESLAYLLYFATEPSFRNCGFGASIVDDLKKEYNERALVIDIELVSDNVDSSDMRVRRQRFYERLGFKETGYMLYDYSGDYNIMSTGNNFDPKEYEKFFSVFPECFYDCKIKLK